MCAQTPLWRSRRLAACSSRGPSAEGILQVVRFICVQHKVMLASLHVKAACCHSIQPPCQKATQDQSMKGWYDLEMAGLEPVKCNAGGGFFNPFNMDIKQIANTNALHWAGRIFALHEVLCLTGVCHFVAVCLPWVFWSFDMHTCVPPDPAG